MSKGNIRVQTENIFPIIKKFLYSDHEIFVRELVSNAVDASRKLRTLSSLGEAKGEVGELRVDVELDAKEKTISIIDRGVGMTQEEILADFPFLEKEDIIASLEYAQKRVNHSTDGPEID